MHLFINSPSYFTREFGVIDEIYKMCSVISRGIDITLYTDSIDTIGIVPVIAPEQETKNGGWKESKHVSLAYRMASISLHSDFESYYRADIALKKQIILDNIFRSLGVIKKRLKRHFDLNAMTNDIMELLRNEKQL